MINYFKYIVIGLVSILCFMIYGKYKTYNTYFKNSNLEKASKDIGTATFHYISEFGYKDLVKETEQIKFENWCKEIYPFFDIYKDILSKGYTIKYFEKENFYFFSLLGEDAKKSNKNISFIKGVDDDSKYSSESPKSFFDYLLSTKDYDIFLFGFSPPNSTTSK